MAAYRPLVLVGGRPRQLADADSVLGTLTGPLNFSQGNFNLGIGQAALTSLTTGTGNLALGYQGLTSCTTGVQNFGLGFQSLLRNTTGSYNVGIGASALQANLVNSACVGLGANALYNSVADHNIAVGFQAGFGLTSGADNILVGFNSGVTNPTTGFGNVLIGSSTATAAAGTNYGVALGYQAVCASNELALGPNLNVQTGYGSSSTQTRPRADVTDSWVVSTDASRTARRIFNVWDTLAREAIRLEASGTAARIGFLGATAVARPSVTGSRGGNAALASLLSALASLGLITDSSTA